MLPRCCSDATKMLLECSAGALFYFFLDFSFFLLFWLLGKLNATWMLFRCYLDAIGMLFRCYSDATQMLPRCSWNATKMLLECSPGALFSFFLDFSFFLLFWLLGK